MKNFILSALLAVTVATTAFAAGENKVNSAVLLSFKLDFRNATDVTWSSKTEYAKATFKVNNQRMEAFYDSKGDMVALSKDILLDELPVSAKRSFAKQYVGYTVKEAIRFETNDEKGFYIKAENDKQSVILKVDDSEKVSIFKKGKK